MTIVEYFAIARDIIIAGAAIVTAWVAASGLRRWKRELLGKENLEVARTLFRAALKIRDAIAACRNPDIAGGEFPKNYSQDSSSKEQAEAFLYVYGNRIEPVWAARKEFDVAVLEAESLWGDEVKVKAKAIRSCTQELIAAIHFCIENKKSGGENFKKNKKLGEKVDNIMKRYTNGTIPFGGGTEVEDEFSKKVEKAVAEVEQYVRPYMRT